MDEQRGEFHLRHLMPFHLLVDEQGDQVVAALVLALGLVEAQQHLRAAGEMNDIEFYLDIRDALIVRRLIVNMEKSRINKLRTLK